MTGKSSTPEPNEAQPSPARSEKPDFWYVVFESMEGNPKINFEKLAQLYHCKNAATARAQFGQKRKLMQSKNTANSATEATVGGAKRGRKPKDSAVDGEPAKRRGRKPKDAAVGPPKKRGRPPKKVVEPVADVVEEEPIEHSFDGSIGENIVLQAGNNAEEEEDTEVEESSDY